MGKIHIDDKYKEKDRDCFPRIEHLLVNIALLLLVGLPLEMTHGGGRVSLVFIPGSFHKTNLIFLNMFLNILTNTIITITLSSYHLIFLQVSLLPLSSTQFQSLVDHW